MPGHMYIHSKMTTEMPEYNPGDYYADSGGTMEYDGFNFIAESNAVFRVSSSWLSIAFRKDF